MSFKRFLIWSSVSPPVQWSGTVCAILKEGIMGNIHVKLYEIWTSGLGDVVYRQFLSGALAALLFKEWNHLCDFGKGHYEEQFSIGSGGNVIKRHLLSSAPAAPLFGGAEPFVQFW